jgi:hypothetical protein
MKLEMGESLVFSWLRHEKHCQIVQLNWKVSPKWKAFVDDEKLDELYKMSDEQFNYASKNKKGSEQFINQGEVDVIGVEFDLKSSGHIKTIHAVDVAFHEGGVRYSGKKEETKCRIIKKYIRKDNYCIKINLKSALS